MNGLHKDAFDSKNNYNLRVSNDTIGRLFHLTWMDCSEPIYFHTLPVLSIKDSILVHKDIHGLWVQNTP